MSPKHSTMGTKRQNIQVLTLDLQEQFTFIYNGVYDHNYTNGVYIHIQTEFTFIYERNCSANEMKRRERERERVGS